MDHARHIAVRTSRGRAGLSRRHVSRLRGQQPSGASALRRLTLGGRNRVPVWSADAEHVGFQSDREADLGIFWQRADGTTEAERSLVPLRAHGCGSYAPDR